MKSIRYHVLRYFKLRRTGRLRYSELSKYFAGLHSPLITETKILAELISMENDNEIRFNEKNESYFLLIDRLNLDRELNIEDTNFIQKNSIKIPTLQNAIQEIQNKQQTKKNQKDQILDQDEKSPIKVGKHQNPTKQILSKLQCPNCKHIIKYKTSKAKRPRKQCPNCKTKRELKYWIPIFQDQKDQEDQKDQKSIASEKSEIDLRKIKDQEDQKDQKSIASEISIQNQETITKTPECKLILKYLADGFYQSNIARKTGISKSKVSRIIHKLLKLNIIREINKYPKFYEIINIPNAKIQSTKTKTNWIEKIEDIHRVEYVLQIENPKVPNGSITFHNLYDKEFPYAKKTELKGWSRYDINFHDDSSHPYGWNIQCNRKCIVCKYILPVKDIVDPIAAKKLIEKQIPYDFFSSKGIQIDKTKTKLRAGGGHARIKTNISHIDNLGVRQAVSVLNEKSTEEIFHADNSEKVKEPGIEVSIHQAAEIISVPQKLNALQFQLQNLTKEIHSIQSERSQIKSLISTLEQFTTTLQGISQQPQSKQQTSEMKSSNLNYI
ncbi:MAG: helix-turn-helix transcriptional regulator [Promethearchaeota archaeon]